VDQGCSNRACGSASTPTSRGSTPCSRQSSYGAEDGGTSKTALLNLRQQPEPQPPQPLTYATAQKHRLTLMSELYKDLARRKHFIEGQAIPYVQRRPNAIL
jgi:hypothetical protein